MEYHPDWKVISGQQSELFRGLASHRENNPSGPAALAETVSNSLRGANEGLQSSTLPFDVHSIIVEVQVTHILLNFI